MSSDRRKLIIDSNILISAAIYPNSPSAQAYRLAVASGDLYASEETMGEIAHVLLRPKFDRYFTQGGPTRERFLRDYQGIVRMATINHISTDCADPKDNKFLSLALSVEADILVSGDQKHLIPMHPYHGIAILSATDFIDIMGH